MEEPGPVCGGGRGTIPTLNAEAVGFLTPLRFSSPQGTSVFVIITKMIVTENQMQGFCPEVRQAAQREPGKEAEEGWGGVGSGRERAFRLSPGTTALLMPWLGWWQASRGSEGPFTHLQPRLSTERGEIPLCV